MAEEQIKRIRLEKSAKYHADNAEQRKNEENKAKKREQERLDEEYALKIFNEQQLDDTQQAGEGSNIHLTTSSNTPEERLRQTLRRSIEQRASNSNQIDFDEEFARQFQFDNVQNNNRLLDVALGEEEESNNQETFVEQTETNSNDGSVTHSTSTMRLGPYNFTLDYSSRLRNRNQPDISPLSYARPFLENIDGESVNRDSFELLNQPFSSLRNFNLRSHPRIFVSSASSSSNSNNPDLFSSLFPNDENLTFDLDNMDYEQLSELGRRIGVVKDRGASTETIESLPTHKYTSEPKNTQTKDSKCEIDKVDVKASDDVSKQCCICMEEFQDGDDVRSLPCFHFFHKDEIDKWLQINKTCPICKVEIDQN